MLAGLVGPVPVVVADVVVQDQSQVPFAVDQHPVGALGSCGAHPPFGVAVRPGVRGGVFTIFTPSVAKIASKALVNLASRSRIRKRKLAYPVADVHEQIAGLLGGPGAGGVGGHAQDVQTCRVATLHHEQDVHAFEGGSWVHMEEVARPAALAPGGTQEPPARTCPRSAGPGSCRPGTQDPPHGRLALTLVAESAQLAVHPAVSPCRILAPAAAPGCGSPGWSAGDLADSGTSICASSSGGARPAAYPA